MNISIKTILKAHDLRLTEPREHILQLFLEKDYALSHPYIESSVNAAIDRVTVYRTLKTFVEKGIIHKVPDDTETAHYALCSPACEGGHGHHQHDHVHFKCVSCQLTQCIDNVHIPKITLPTGYQFLEANLLVQGICDKCHNI